MWRFWSSAAALGVALCSCATPLGALRDRGTFQTSIGHFRISYSAKDRAPQQRVRQATMNAQGRLAQWGALVEPVSLHVLPTHEALEEAVNRRGYTWLRAWATYDQVFVQSPRTWAVFGATQNEIDELMLHELTHCLMYQRAATRETWTHKQIPLWFREGMASYTADQGYRWPSLETLASYLEREPDADPVLEPEPLYQEQSDIVYGAAHHAFTFLVRRYGVERIGAVLREMRAGRAFAEAFVRAVGLLPEAFGADFKRYVRLRGFRGGRHRGLPLLVPHLGAPPAESEVAPEPSLDPPRTECRLR